MARNPVVWFEIYVQDMEKVRKFYEAVFCIQLEPMENPDMQMWAFPAQPGATGAAGSLVQMKGFSSGGTSTIVYFSCADCATEAKRAAASGGSIVKKKFSIGQNGFISLVTDIEGNMIGLHSQH